MNATKSSGKHGRDRSIRGKLCRWLGLLSLLFMQLNGQYAIAQADVVAIGNNGSYALSRSFTYIEDTGATLTLDDVLAPGVQAAFKPVKQGANATNFGTTNSAIWLRVKVRTGDNAPRRWLMELAYPPLDRLDLYVSNRLGLFDHQSGGDSLPVRARVVAHRSHVQPIDLEPGHESTLYLRVASQGAVSAPVTLWQPAALWQSDQTAYLIFGLYFGLLIGLLAYNLLLFLSVRDNAYLIYVTFIGCIGLSQAANTGLGGQFLWPDSLWWNGIAINAAHSASGIFGFLFVRSFLHTGSKVPKLDLWIKGQLALWFSALVASLVLPYKVAALMVTWLAILCVLTIVLAAAMSIRRRHPGAQSFALAWFAFLFGVVVQVMHNNGLLPSNAITVDALLIGSALEMVLLSFALAGRINTTRQEKEAAQAQVTSEQAMVQALQQSQERYLSVIEHLAEGMVVIQSDRIVFVNFRATEILEATKAEIIEGGFLSRIHAEDRVALADHVRRRLAGFEVAQLREVRLDLGQQSTKWLEFGDNTVPWDGGHGLLIFFVDVTQRHNAEMVTRAALDRQHELNELRSRFVAMTSHEFRTPLATILSAQGLLKRFSDRLPEDQKQELLGMIESGVNRMTGMLERVLLLGQAEAHMLEFKPCKLDLVALCQSLIDDSKRLHPESQCNIVMEFLSESLGGLYDENLLRHIFSNLLSNAIKYSPVGGNVRLKILSQGQQTVFEVSDEGIGIPAEEIDHLFESFHRASNVGDIQGTGLGLAIVKLSVDLHGGTVEARSRLGHGTRFTVRLGVA